MTDLVSTDFGISNNETTSSMSKVADKHCVKTPTIYDRTMKRLFSHREILSFIIKNSIKDIDKSLTKDEIYKRLGNKSWLDSPNDSMIIEGGNIESKRHDGLDMDFDFITTLPYNNGTVDLFIINLEYQNKLKPGYSLEKRALTYISRLIDDCVNNQKSTNIAYDKVRGIYQIWILPTAKENHIKRYYIVQEEDDKITRQHPMNLIESVFIYLNRDINSSKTPLFELLNSVLSFNDIKEEREIIMEKYLNTDNINIEEVNDELSVFEHIVLEELDKRYEEGEEKGEEKMIINMYNNNMDLHQIAKISNRSIEEIEKILSKNTII